MMPYPKRIEKTKEKLLNEGYKLIDSTFEGEKLEKWYIKYDEDNNKPIIYNIYRNNLINGIINYEHNGKKRSNFIVFTHKGKQSRVTFDRLILSYLKNVDYENENESKIILTYKNKMLDTPILVYKNGECYRLKNQQSNAGGNGLKIITNRLKVLIKFTKDIDGYFQNKIDGIGISQHRLVMFAFHYRDDYENLQVDHINRIRIDNRLENLRWTTHMENQLNKSNDSQVKLKKIQCSRDNSINKSGIKYIFYNNFENCKSWVYSRTYNKILIKKICKNKINLICYSFIVNLKILSGYYGNKDYFMYSEVIKGKKITLKNQNKEELEFIKKKIKELRNNNPEITCEEIKNIFNIQKNKEFKKYNHKSPDIENTFKKELINYIMYTFYNNGKIFSKTHNKFLNIKSNKKGYIRTIFINDLNERKSWAIHRIIATCFIPNPENKPYVDHINGVRNDNRVENLRWVTPQENANNKQ